jgi:hypothetical protein
MMVRRALLCRAHDRVMAGLVPAIHDALAHVADADAPSKCRHDT